jgi:hemolysin D
VKVIQSIETGKTTSVPVSNGSRVTAGDLLVELDETELKSNEDVVLTELEALSDEVAIAARSPSSQHANGRRKG